MQSGDIVSYREPLVVGYTRDVFTSGDTERIAVDYLEARHSGQAYQVEDVRRIVIRNTCC